MRKNTPTIAITAAMIARNTAVNTFMNATRPVRTCDTVDSVVGVGGDGNVIVC
jgi:hypothetical protein